MRALGWLLPVVGLPLACGDDTAGGSVHDAGTDATSSIGGAAGSTATGGAGSGGTAGSTGGAAGSSVGGAAGSGAVAGAAGSGGVSSFSCLPEMKGTTNGGGRCDGLNQAYTARGINTGFYPYRAKVATPQYSGDFSGDPNSRFQAGASSAGVILQMIPAGAYLGVNSSPPFYDPPGDCLAVACGDGAMGACQTSNPPLRPSIAGFVWAYAYSGASHMQGWVPFDADHLEFAGFDPNHPCALGPAGLDYEVSEACGQPTACKGNAGSCPAANRCDEGSDDCGSCGGSSASTLTPSAHQFVVSPPSAAVACTTKNPPHPSVKCYPNGNAIDHYFVYPFGAYLYWAQDSTTKHWLHYGDHAQAYFKNRDSAGVLWYFIEVTQSGAPTLTPPSDGAGAGGGCGPGNPAACKPCQNGGTCGFIQDVFLKPA